MKHALPQLVTLRPLPRSLNPLHVSSPRGGDGDKPGITGEDSRQDKSGGLATVAVSCCLSNREA